LTHSKQPKFVPVTGTIAARCKIATADDAGQVFDEMRAIAIGFMRRTEDVENQLNFIVATVYVNCKKQAEQGDAWAGEMLKWLDPEIAKLKDFRERYLVDIAGRPA
jgi:hypothetical protein